MELKRKVQFVTITLARYQELCRDEEKLIRLENAGVDNWEGYDHAMEGLHDEEDD